MSIGVGQEQANIIYRMDEHLRGKLDPDKLWENTFIYLQIDRRKRGEVFTIEDHIRGMVYSMLSGGTAWDRFAKEAGPQTRCITPADKVFRNYDPEELLSSSPEQLQNELKEIHLASRFIGNQIKALLTVNIPKLMAWERECGSIDNYYRQFFIMDKGKAVPISIIRELAAPASKNKLAQMDVPLVCEYLKNVGYDCFPKPDTHIRRILGRDILGLSASREAPPYQAIEIVSMLAEQAGKSAAEADYILWSYCATRYGEICTSKNPKCSECVVISQCKNHA